MYIIDRIKNWKSSKDFKKKVRDWSIIYKTSSSEKERIIKDYVSLYESKGLTLDEYYDFEFEKQSPEFRYSFLGLNEQRFYLDVLNPMKWYSFARNKYAAHKMFENTGIRTSTLYCYYDPDSRIEGSKEIASSVVDVVRILKSKEVQSCVIKATEESHGDNVVVIKKIEYQDSDCILHLFDGTITRLSSVLSTHPRIFESLITQTKQFSSFNETSVNTVRFMTTLYPDGSARVIATFIKIGRAGSCVDNAGSGGNVDVNVDIETGEIKNAIQFDGWRKIKEIDKHPDSGTPLNGVIIENWETIKSEVIKYQQAFPWCKAAGWDIAITDQGPVVIEVNDFWDRTGQFFIRRGWREEIRDCYMAWKQTDYKASMCRQRNNLTRAHLHNIISKK